ncbi:MAG: ABC-2 type transport system ATP-binding protein [Mariniblastus sp.]|jgi:ABC-2 type transport system ATP-binding protein
MPSLISLENIIKNYKSMRALNGVNLDIKPGVTGLLGPNGAGKSTLIKLLLGLVKITSGTGSILGHKLGSDGRMIRNKVGYMPEDDCYIPGMSGVEVVRFSACLSGLPATEALRRAHEILDFCGMKQERYRVIDTYSTGMRQKIKFAAAIVHDPEFLILDEPTSGLDPEEREALLSRIRLLWTQSGKSVLISTHILPDVQAICDDVVILSNGQIRLSESLENLSKTDSPSFSVRVLNDPAKLVEALQRNSLEPQTTPDGSIVIESQDPELATLIWNSARQSETVIQSFIPAKNSLEEIFMTTVKEASARDSAKELEASNANS